MGHFGFRALPSATLIGRYLGDESAGAMFAGCAAHAFLPLSHPLTASFGTLLLMSGHTVGWPVAAGGSQAVADTMAAYLRSLGGEIRTGTNVTSLADLPAHRVALFDTDPHQLASIAAGELPSRYRRRLTSYKSGPAAWKVDYALDGPVPWTDEACRRAGTVHIGGTSSEIAAAEAEVARGRMPERPFMLVAQQSLVDSSRAPAGKHTLWTYAHVPNGYDGDATDALERQLERFAPGFRDLVLARHVTTPSELEAYNPNYRGGDITGGSHRRHAAGVPTYPWRCVRIAPPTPRSGSARHRPHRAVECTACAATTRRVPSFVDRSPSSIARAPASAVRQLVWFDRRHHVRPRRMVVQDVVLDLVVVAEPEVAVRALVGEVLHGSIVSPDGLRRKDLWSLVRRHRRPRRLTSAWLVPRDRGSRRGTTWRRRGASRRCGR